MIQSFQLVLLRNFAWQVDVELLRAELPYVAPLRYGTSTTLPKLIPSSIKR